MDPLEEQQQELDILQSIYPDELTILSPTRFQINILLDTESKRKHAVSLDVTYTDNYPESPPILNVSEGDPSIGANGEEYADDSEEEEDEDNYDDDDDHTMSKKLLNLIETVKLDTTDYDELLEKIKEEAEDMVGMASVFSLASSLKDHGEVAFDAKFKSQEKELLDKRKVREEIEQKKFVGTKVTSDSFSKWRVSFRSELGIDKRLDERYAGVHKGRLTGKQIFEQGLASGDDLVADEDVNDVDMAELKKNMEKASI